MTDDRISYADRYDKLIYDDTTIDFKFTLKIFKNVLNVLCADNGITLTDFCTIIAKFLHGFEPKKRSICFIGVSDAGKSLFKRNILCLYERHEIGKLSQPSHYMSDFWKSDLVNKEIYCFEEFSPSSLNMIQQIKIIAEGSDNNDTNVKFEDNVDLPARPFIITMNGDRPEDIAGDYYDEFDALANRCHIFVFKTKLEDIIPKRYIKYIDAPNGGVVFHHLINEYSINKCLWNEYEVSEYEKIAYIALDN